MFPQEFTVPTDTLWGELGAENAALERAAFLFTGLRSATCECFFPFYFLSQGSGPEVSGSVAVVLSLQ
jgi:hypothetical protein